MDKSYKLGYWLLFICAVCFVVATTVFVVCRPAEPTVSDIHLSVVTDSTGVMDVTTLQSIDSLKVLVKQQNADMHERYAYMVEQKQNENSLIAFGSVIISIILAIFGFFGYKSFTSIEEKALTNAEDKVKTKVNSEMVTMQSTLEKELKGTINKRFLEEYKERLGEEVGKKLNENYNESISAKLNYIQENGKSFENLQDRVSQLEQFVSQLQDQGVVVKFTPAPGIQKDVDEFAAERKKNKGTEPAKEEKGDEQ